MVEEAQKNKGALYMRNFFTATIGKITSTHIILVDVNIIKNNTHYQFRDHVWVKRSKRWDRLKNLSGGKTVNFHGRIYDYDGYDKNYNSCKKKGINKIIKIVVVGSKLFLFGSSFQS